MAEAELQTLMSQSCLCYLFLNVSEQKSQENRHEVTKLGGKEEKVEKDTGRQ